jgi:hypothetical protein
MTTWAGLTVFKTLIKNISMYTLNSSVSKLSLLVLLIYTLYIYMLLYKILQMFINIDSTNKLS